MSAQDIAGLGSIYKTFSVVSAFKHFQVSLPLCLGPLIRPTGAVDFMRILKHYQLLVDPITQNRFQFPIFHDSVHSDVIEISLNAMHANEC